MNFLADVATAATPPARKLVLFGGLHLGILAATVLLPAAMSLATRRRDRPELARWLAWGLALVLVADRLFALGVGLHTGHVARWVDALPMHLCDWASVAVVIALVWGGQRAYELAYFWGLSGTVQALLTPDTAEDFFSPLFISFFVSHCGIVISVLFLTWGLKFQPRPGAVWRAWGWSQLYLAAAGLVNYLGHANFGYLAAKPAHSSLLDYFAPWPWYVLQLELAAVAFFGFFYLPFWLGNLRRPAQAAPAATPRAGT